MRTGSVWVNSNGEPLVILKVIPPEAGLIEFVHASKLVAVEGDKWEYRILHLTTRFIRKHYTECEEYKD